MADPLPVETRETTGKRRNKRLRIAGKIPAVLYGHGQDCVNLQAPREAVWLVIRHGGHLVELKGAVNETALIRDVQWDTYGTEILHIDLNRVSAGESVTLTVPVELKGEAIGARSGGVIQHVTHELEIDCPVTSIIDRFEVKIGSLEVDGVIHAGEIPLPAGATLLTDPNAVVVQCIVPREELDETAGGSGAEPEVIGRKKEDGEDSE